MAPTKLQKRWAEFSSGPWKRKQWGKYIAGFLSRNPRKEHLYIVKNTDLIKLEAKMAKNLPLMDSCGTEEWTKINKTKKTQGYNVDYAN